MHGAAMPFMAQPNHAAQRQFTAAKPPIHTTEGSEYRQGRVNGKW